MITDMDGARESSTCRSDPFVTDLHNALVARTVHFFYGLSANSAPRFTAMCTRERLQRDSLDGAKHYISEQSTFTILCPIIARR